MVGTGSSGRVQICERFYLFVFFSSPRLTWDDLLQCQNAGSPMRPTTNPSIERTPTRSIQSNPRPSQMPLLTVKFSGTSSLTRQRFSTSSPRWNPHPVPLSLPSALISPSPCADPESKVNITGIVWYDGAPAEVTGGIGVPPVMGGCRGKRGHVTIPSPALFPSPSRALR